MRSASRGMTAKFEGLVQNYSGLVVALVAKAPAAAVRGSGCVCEKL